MKFHIVGLKCSACGAYNTCRTRKKEAEVNNQPSGEATNQPPPESKLITKLNNLTKCPNF